MIIALIISKVAEKILHFFGRGATTLPGKIALFIKKDILGKLSEKVKVIIITGTNGKTTSARMIEEGFKKSGKSYFINRSGANLITGITTSFIVNSNVFGRCKKDYAIIECDENALKKVSLYVDAEILLVTNVFRDQLDRYGEVSSTLFAIKIGAENMENCKLVLNADDPLTFSLSRLQNSYVTYGVNIPLKLGGKSDTECCIFCKEPYKYKYKTYSQLGSFYCPNCLYKRENPMFSADEIIESTADYSVVFANLNGKNSLLRINLGGVYNIYNSLGAAAVLSLLNIDNVTIENALSSFGGAFGRMENFGKTRMLLVKNPAGFTQTMNYIYPLEISNLIFVLNDKDADGTDVSWIWDAEIKISEKVKNIYAFGVRSGDMALRLKYEGYEPKIIDSYEEFYNLTDEGNTVIIPTYTAMMTLRPYLAKKYQKEEFWK